MLVARTNGPCEFAGNHVVYSTFVAAQKPLHLSDFDERPLKRGQCHRNVRGPGVEDIDDWPVAT